MQVITDKCIIRIYKNGKCEKDEICCSRIWITVTRFLYEIKIHDE